MPREIISPPIWLLVCIAGLPLLSETVYTPVLPEIARVFRVQESVVEYTLTIYLFGFALGTLFWGKLSDRLGRKPCMLAGLLVFIAGCLGCYMAGRNINSGIELLMISRLVQAFGGSVGSVLCQAVARDSFHGPNLGKVYASVGSALAIFPALGPIVGGIIAEYFVWSNIFLFLMIVAVIVNVLIITILPETHQKSRRMPIPFMHTALRLIQDRKVIGCGLLVAGSNGISFSYFAEGSFYLTQCLGMSPTLYGASFCLIAAAAMLGGMCSRKLLLHYSPQNIMNFGLILMTLSSSVLSSIILMHYYVISFPPLSLIAGTLLNQMASAFGISLVTSNALALALTQYKNAVGTASSLFGFCYYCGISLCTLGMGTLHNGKLLAMPLYFFVLSVMMLLAQKIFMRDSELE